MALPSDRMDSEKGCISVVWYFVHIFLGIISGLIVLAVYHSKCPKLALKHLVVSILITLVPVLIVALTWGAIFSLSA